MPVETKEIPKLSEKNQRNFWKKVDKTPGHGPDGDCWVWTARKAGSGYGAFDIGGKSYRAHRVAFVLAGGVIPAGMCVLHRKDVPGCVNPAHLWLGTQADNARDRDKKGRCRVGVGERQGSSKLTAAKILEIRCKYAAGGISHRDLAVGFEVDHATIGRILRRETWRHLP